MKNKKNNNDIGNIPKKDSLLGEVSRFKTKINKVGDKTIFDVGGRTIKIDSKSRYFKKIRNIILADGGLKKAHFMKRPKKSLK